MSVMNPIGVFILVGIAAFIIYVGIDEHNQKIERRVRETSERYQNMQALNSKYDFYEFPENYIFYKSLNSKAQLDKFDYDRFFEEKIQENWPKVEEMVNKATENKRLLKRYREEIHDWVAPLREETFAKSLGISFDKYRKYEEKSVNEITLDPRTDVSFVCQVSYVSPKGRNSYSGERSYTIADLLVHKRHIEELEKQKELDFERKHQDDLERIRNFRLMDDDFMSKVFEDKTCAEFLLKIILNRDDLTVQEVHGQHDLKNLQGRSVRLDILAIDRENRAYNIEVQRSDRGAGVKRARYNSSLLDANLTQTGDAYDALNETYVIFITENDVLKAGLPIYHIHRMVEETGAVFNDQSHIIYVNSQIKDESALGKLMHDFFCTDAKDMFYPVLANRVQYFKQDAKGVATMCRAMEEMRNETVRERNIEIAKTMLASKKLSYEDIALFSGLTVDEVKSLDAKKPA